MNIDNLRKWTHELRITALGQTRETLAEQEVDEDNNSIESTTACCCLGIGELCRGADLDDLWGEALPPHAFAEWLGLNAVNPTVDPMLDIPVEHLPLGYTLVDGSVNVSCSILNDNWHLTFEQIADMIDYFGLWEEA